MHFIEYLIQLIKDNQSVVSMGNPIPPLKSYPYLSFNKKE